MIFSTEEGYSELARSTLSFIGNRHWDEGGVKAGFYNKMIHHGFYLIFNGETDERSLSQWGDEVVSPFEALKYIKNNILETTGKIIWGLVFTLYPDGRFNIEYDYNKPEGYEESDDEISIEDAVKSFQSLSDIQDIQK